MEDIIGFIFITFFIEILFWGIAYGVGFVLTPIISFGNWKADSLMKNEKHRVKGIKQTGLMVFEISGQRYLGAYGVAFLGFIFMITTATSAIILFH